MRSIICTAFGVIAVIVLLLLTPNHVYTPKGITLPASEKSYPATSPSDVVIYHQSPNANYQVIAQIRAEMAFQQSLSSSQDALIQHVKALAARHGANAVIVEALVPDNGVQKAFTFIGDAIRLPARTPITNGAQ